MKLQDKVTIITGAGQGIGREYALRFADEGAKVALADINKENVRHVAKEVGAKVCGVVGRDGGYTAQAADACVVIPTVNPAHITPHAEAFQGVVWHLLVSHPRLKQAETKWESVK